MIQANNEGYTAFIAGKRLKDNPYHYGTEDYYQWKAGWFEAWDNDGELYEAEPANSTAVILMLVGIILACVFLLANVLGWSPW